MAKELSYPKSTRVHHFKIVGNINPTSICFHVGKLRTCDISYVPPNVASDFVQRLKRVRLLYLHDCELKQVPESIGYLIHLRVLLLSDNPLVELPETIGNLYNLQQLFLERIHELSSLAHSLGKLSNLISIIPGEMALEKAPESVEKLINLQSLGTIRVEAGKRNLGLLIDLNQLRLLEIEFISDYGDDVDANKAAIGRKEHVKEYALTFNEYKVAYDVVEALRPHPNVQTLKIYHQFPNWIISLDNLAKLEIHNGEKVSTLPPLWQLQSLKELLISEIYASEIIGREFLGMNNNDPNKKFPAFPKLVKLQFFDCTELTGWEDLTPEEDSNHAITVMPNLEILEFDRCNMFSEVPHRLLRQASSLKKLRIYKKPSYRRRGQSSLFDFDVTKISEGVLGGLDLRVSGGGQEMNVKYSRKVPTPISYHSYNTLLDIYCAGEPITFLPPMGKIPYLEILTITRFSCLKFIGREFLGIDNDDHFVAFPNLVKFEISSCNSLEGWEDLKPEDEGKISVMPKLEDLQIQSFQNFQVSPCGKTSTMP